MLKILQPKLFGVLFSTLLLLNTSPSFAESELCDGIINYKAKEDKKSVYGTLNCKGSTNVGALLKVWLPEFQKLYPQVKTSMDFQGSSNGIQGLIDGTATIGATSRQIKQTELEEFQKMKGYHPTEIKVSLDALVIYVNRLNTLNSITLEELDAVFSSSRKREYPHSIETWETLNSTKEKINIYLFDKNSGTRSFFRHNIMLKGIFNQNNIVSDEYTTTAEVIEQIAADKNGICFGSVGVKNFKVKALSLSKRKNYPIYSPSNHDIRSGNYPLTRFFYIYLDVPPDKTIPSLLYEFCKFILSYEGQSINIRTGGLALSPKQIGIELSKMRRD